ncbi:MAG TPA: serine/threonine-protein kinase [Kofleriaceae bacterium]|nr:serine/threonine-protein kinase [Kofleriaceae bacterium]
MGELAGIFAIIGVFGPFFYWLKRRYDLKERTLEGQGGGDRKQLEGLDKERKLLQERVENLESIVCSVDFELNQRIARLAAGDSHSPRPALAAGAAEAAGNPATSGTLPASPRPAEPLRATPELPLGEVIGNRYRVQRLLGRGGMGAVYLADDEVLGEPVALKIIASAWSTDPGALVDRFRREASAARKVSSPNVIRIHDLGETRDGLLYLSMEYFPGRTLADMLAARGRLSAADLADIGGQVCDGLGAAHGAGVVHRDLKPQNVLVGERNAVKLIDFGLAKTAFLASLTATGLMMGSPHYMSPEQVRGKECDARSDIYSLGALVYHAATGHPPFEGENAIAIGFAHCSEAPRPPREICPDLSERLSDMLLRALAKDPRQRPASAAEFRAAL